jgi:hypothetical protein
VSGKQESLREGPETLSQSYEFFLKLLGRVPSQEETARFDRIARATNWPDDDGMWYFIYINEFYDDRLKKRLQEIDIAPEDAIRRTEEGIKKMVRRIMEEMSDSLEKQLTEITARRDRWANIRSWGLFVGALSIFFAVVFNTGHVMGAGQPPFWFHPRNRLEWFASLFFLVPSGWVVFLGSLPYALYTLKDSFLGFPKKVSKIFSSEGSAVSLPALGDLVITVLKAMFSLFIIAFSCLFFLI